MLEKFVKTDWSSYEEFKKGLSITVPAGFNFAYDIVDEWARLKPQKTALVWCNEQGASRSFTFAELKRWSDKAANFFASIGIGKGDPVMLILKRHSEYWFAVLALHKLGAVAIPATHLLTKKDIAYRNNAAGIKAIVSVDDEKVMNAIDEALPESKSLQARVVVGPLGKARAEWWSFDLGVEEAPASWSRPSGPAATAVSDMMLLYFTSGTTGMPKMVSHDFSYPLGHIITAKYWQNINEEGLHLTVADTGWAKAAWGKIYGQWIVGAAVFVYEYERFVPKDMIKILEKYRVTSFCAPPTIFRYLIKEDLTQYDWSALKYCTVAGEPLNPEVYNRFLELTGIKLMEGYGQTETVVLVATFPWLEPKPGSMGKPSPIYDVDIVDEVGKSCESGEVGQIAIRLDRGKPTGMFNGYHRDPTLTGKVWHDNMYFTGDTAWKDEDGYYWFVGRSDDLIKSSGYRIGPFEVESALLEHPAVLECAVTGVPDPERGQVVKATIVLSKGYGASDDLVVELQDHVKKVTAPYKYPRIVEFVTELPKTISGKIRRVEIREKEKK